MTPHHGLTKCTLCPRLVEWREHVAEVKRASFSTDEYWGRPVPALGPLEAPILIVGLAPAAHGANRTGRMFCGDNSGRWLFRALHRVGLTDREMGEEPPWPNTTGCRITAVAHCAPPDNKPTATEVNTCRQTWLVPEVGAMPNLRVVVALGGVAWTNVARVGKELGWSIPSPRPSFAHGRVVDPDDGPTLVASFHPSQQNTFTGKLTEAMFDDLWSTVVSLA